MIDLKGPVVGNIDSKATKIIHVVRQYAPAIGGLENFVKALAEQQVRQGLDISVVTLDTNFSSGEKYARQEVMNGVNIYRIPYVGSRRYPIALSVLRHIKRGAIVHVHCTDFFSDFLALTKPVHRANLLLSTHGGFFHTKYASNAKILYFKTITKLTLMAYRRVFACSVGDFDRFSMITRNIELIENGVEVERFATKEKDRQIEGQCIFIGRLSSNKRVDLLIETFAAVIKICPHVRLTIVGNDYEGLLSGYRDKIKQLKVDRSITIKTGVSDIEIESIVSESQYIVSASEYEGFGMTIIEGMSAGLLPIVSDIPSFTRIVNDSKVGFISDFKGDAPGKIANYISSGVSQVDAGRSKVYSERYSWVSVERNFYSSYMQALGLYSMNIHGLEVLNISLNEALDYIVESDSSNPIKLAFANANTINIANSDSLYMKVLSAFVVLPDGIGVDIAAKYKYGRKFKANLNGTDFTPALLRAIKPSRIYVLGGEPGISEKALKILSEKFPQHMWVGNHHGYIDSKESEAIAQEISGLLVDVLLVAMGNPIQEKWIDRYVDQSRVKLAVGVGAFLDFTVGKVDRAPLWVRYIRMEWLYRLLQEPARMWRRYIIGNVGFIARTLRMGGK